MIECLNKECIYNKNNECTSGAIVKLGVQCDGRIKPTHTPSYAEEQLNHAIEKENKNCPNWEEEYHKLKKENEELQKELKDIKHIYYNSDISEVKEDNEDYSVKITILEQEKKELEKANQGLAAESKERYQTIRKLQRLIEDNTENAILSNKVEDLERENDSLKLKTAVTEKLEIEINNLNAIIDGKDDEIENLKATIENEQIANEIIDDETKELKEQIKRLEKSTNENYYNWIETQKKNEKLIYKNSKLSEKVEVLKEGNIKLLELL